MNEIFPLDHHTLAADPRLKDLAAELAVHACIDSPASFNAYCQHVCRAWVQRFGENDAASPPFTERLRQIEAGEAGTIPTSWGGVVVTRHEPPQVEKFLAVRRGGYLALEKHEQKDENLEVQSGVGVLLSRQTPEKPLIVQCIAPGDKLHFLPGQEHCLIGVENLLVFERSTDPKGMDRDLIFLYEPA